MNLRVLPPPLKLRRAAVALCEGGRVLLRNCDRLLTPRTCQAAIAPTTMNAKAAKVAKLSTTCNRESRDPLRRGSGRRRRREATPFATLAAFAFIRSVRGRVASEP